MIRNDLHIHSVQSLCGIHTLLEIVEIASKKGLRTINISDHGKASGKNINFGVVTNIKRFPKSIISSNGTNINVLAGIEANILDIDGNSDFPIKYTSKFDLVSAGFHNNASELFLKKSEIENTKSLEMYLRRFPLDILTHPCKASFPLDIEVVVDLACHYGFALEVNNTNLRVDKTNLEKLESMILLSLQKGAILVECSDGHTFYEIGENDKILQFLGKLKLSNHDIFINHDDHKLNIFLKERKNIRIK